MTTKENNVDNNRYYVTQDYLSGWAVEDEDGDKPVARTRTKEDAELVANALNVTVPKPQFFAKDDRVYDRKADHEGSEDYIVICYSSENDEYTAEGLAKFVASKLNSVGKDEVIG